jgi:hypothetical protein
MSVQLPMAKLSIKRAKLGGLGLRRWLVWCPCCARFLVNPASTADWDWERVWETVDGHLLMNQMSDNHSDHWRMEVAGSEPV